MSYLKHWCKPAPLQSSSYCASHSGESFPFIRNAPKKNAFFCQFSLSHTTLSVNSKQFFIIHLNTRRAKSVCALAPQVPHILTFVNPFNGEDLAFLVFVRLCCVKYASWKLIIYNSSACEQLKIMRRHSRLRWECFFFCICLALRRKRWLLYFCNFLLFPLGLCVCGFCVLIGICFSLNVTEDMLLLWLNHLPLKFVIR